MEKFRDKLSLQLKLNAAGIIVLAIVQAVAFTRNVRPVMADDHWADMWNGFVAGAAMGIMALLVAGIIMNVRALRNENVLKRMYIKENDERAAKIYTAARSAGTTTFLLVGLVAAVAAGYFSIAVSIAIVACVVVNSLLCMLYKLYYSRKY